jgi:high-affinity nickel-transport protein
MELLHKLQNFFRTTSPGFRRRLFGIFAFLALFNVSVWIYAFFVWHSYPVFLGLVTLAYGLGLRHAVDADHIAAIDNTTRKLMHEGKRPVGVGFFFSLGHSTIVIILSVLVAFSAAFVKNNLPSFTHVGFLIGTSVSSFFLLLIGVINLIVLFDIFRTWRIVVKNQGRRRGTYKSMSLDKCLNKRGLTTGLLRPFLKVVRESWNMYFVGFLFGLGFDTASEVGLLSISAATGASGMETMNIIVLPLAFTAGMSLIDTLDGIFMLGAYGWAYVKPIRKLYYNMNITFISVVIALFIGSIEGMQVIFSQLKLTGGFFDLINNLDFGNLGYIIIIAFLLSWIISIFIYKFKGYDHLDLL